MLFSGRELTSPAGVQLLERLCMTQLGAAISEHKKGLQISGALAQVRSAASLTILGHNRTDRNIAQLRLAK
jgi:hypothetical protein